MSLIFGGKGRTLALSWWKRARGYSLLSADVLLLDGLTGHLADANAVLDVSELQTQILSSDGQPGAPLTWPRLRRQLFQKSNDFDKSANERVLL